MPLVLAIEPDPRQATYISSIVKDLGADLVLVECAADAVKALQTRAPDLVLVPALMSPADDAALVDALHAATTSAGGRILITPRFAASSGKRSSGSGLITRWRQRRRKGPSAPEGCDPAVFAEQVVAYLQESRPEHVAPPPIREPVAEPIREPTREMTSEEVLRQIASGVVVDVQEIVADPLEESEFPVESAPAENVAFERVTEPVLAGEPPAPVDPGADTASHGASEVLAPTPATAIEEGPLPAAIPHFEAGAEEWRDLIASLRRSVEALRFEEWLGQPSATGATTPDEWGIYDPDRYGMAAFIKRLDTPGQSPEA
jgi:CheY-like chemotaxis protein